MLKIIYGKNGEPISDFKVYEFVDQIVNTCNYSHPEVMTVATASELCFMTFGLKALEDKIPLNEIEFYFEEEKLNFHPFCGIEEPKNRTLGFFSEVIDTAIKVGYQKMRRNFN